MPTVCPGMPKVMYAGMKVCKVFLEMPKVFEGYTFGWASLRGPLAHSKHWVGEGCLDDLGNIHQNISSREIAYIGKSLSNLFLKVTL